MPANASIYLPVDSVDLKAMFPNVRTDKGLFRKLSYYEFQINQDGVKLNIMDRQKVGAHLQGFLGYIAAFPSDNPEAQQLPTKIAHTKMVLGLITEGDFDTNPGLWPALCQVAGTYNGHIFAYNSIWTPQGVCLAGPLANQPWPVG